MEGGVFFYGKIWFKNNIKYSINCVGSFFEKYGFVVFVVGKVKY